MINFYPVNRENQGEFLTLLTDNPMQGRVNTALTREPCYFAGKDYFGVEQAFLAKEDNQTIGCYQFTTHQGFINGSLTSLGYLNSLRVSHQFRHKIRVIKAGFKHLQQRLVLPTYNYTSIASDNLTARRLLEKGINGLPRYEYVGELCTLVISKHRAKKHKLWQEATDDKVWLDFYHQQASQSLLAPYLSESWLKQSTLTPLVYRDNSGLKACAVLWQQQTFKQVKITYYHPMFRILRPFYNGYSLLTKRPCLPALQKILPQTFLAFFYCVDIQQTVSLVADALEHCQTPLLTLSFAAKNPQCASIVKAFKPLVYKTSIYRVNFMDEQPPLQSQSFHLEAAIL